MSVVVRHHAAGMTAEQYSAIADVTMGDLRAAKGFVAHYAFLEGDGVTVSEIWETQADHDAFFDEYIRPKLPQEIPTPAVFEVINAATTRHIVGGAAHAARNAVGVLGGAAEGAWSWASSRLRGLTRSSEKAEAAPKSEPEITTTPKPKPESSETAPAQSMPSEVPPAKGGTATDKPTPPSGATGGTSPST